jgi:hypothetical protein
VGNQSQYGDGTALRQILRNSGRDDGELVDDDVRCAQVFQFPGQQFGKNTLLLCAGDRIGLMPGLGIQADIAHEPADDCL